MRSASARALALTLLLASPALAASPPAGGGSSTPEPRPVEIGGRVDSSVPQRNTPTALQIAGTVTDSAGSGLPDLVVKVFARGVLAGSARTGADGTFLLDADVMMGPDVTADLWVQSPDPERYVDANVVLSEAKAARDLALFSACTPRAQFFQNATDLKIQMLSPRERQKAVLEQGCLAESGSDG